MKLEFKKRLIHRVSFNKERFGIELENALRKLNRTDRNSLKTWVKDQYGAKYPNIRQRMIDKESNRIRLGL